MRQKVGFVTCVELGRSCIEEVHALGGAFSLFLTLRDDLATHKAGRVFLDDLARDSATPLVKIRHINEPAAIRAIKAADLDWLFIIGWSQIADKGVLTAPRKGVLGMHPTLLPVGRGRAAIPWAILKGLRKTGVTLFKLDEGVDTGSLVAQTEIPLSPDETALTLYKRVNAAHRELIRRAWPALERGGLKLVPQNEAEATVWPARTPADGWLRPAMTVGEVDRLVRAVTRPYPGARVRINGATHVLWSGEIAHRHEGGEGALLIQCADGIYKATDYERLATG